MFVNCFFNYIYNCFNILFGTILSGTVLYGNILQFGTVLSGTVCPDTLPSTIVYNGVALGEISQKFEMTLAEPHNLP